MNPFLSVEIQRDLVLASESPRRREILEKLGFEFEIAPTGADEGGIECGDHERFTILLAERKGMEARGAHPEKTIIAADTIVVCRDTRLGKPSNAAEASAMLRLLSGRAHDVVTGLALLAPGGRCVARAERTKVYVRSLSEKDIMRYVDTGEPFGKAGAYAIQGYAAPFIERIEGCYFNVVGLPVALLFKMFSELEEVTK